jgi:sugar diacid utilization regulator
MSRVSNPSDRGPAIRPGELQTIVEALAKRLDRAVAVDDPQLRLLAHTAHDHKVDRHRIASVLGRRANDQSAQHSFRQGIASATGPVRIPAAPEWDHLGRLCVPVRCLDLLLGYLWLIDDEETLTECEIRLASDAAAAAGEVLLRERIHSEEQSDRDRELLRDLLSAMPDIRRHAADDLVDRHRLPSLSEVCVVIVQVYAGTNTATSTAAGLALDAAMQRVAIDARPVHSLATTQAGGRGLLLLAAEGKKLELEVKSIANELFTQLKRYVLPTSRVRVCIGPIVSGALEAYQSHEGALKTLRVVEVVHGFSDIARWEDLGIFQILASLPLSELPADAIPRGLTRLLDLDASLVRTLEVYLDAGGDVTMTVNKLCIHRTSLYPRLRKIDQITGMRLADGSDRLLLHLGLKLARLTGTA